MRVLPLLVLAVAPVLHAQPVVIERVFPNLTFSVPIDLQNAGDGTDRLFVAEQGGRIFVFPSDPDVTAATVYLDLTDRILVNDRFGLLGFAFHPDYATNGYVYVHYNAANPDRSVIARFTVSADPDVADPDSELILLEVGQPHRFHNGGQLLFGPDDGYLYIPLGDGGPGGDPNGNGQDRTTLLGTMLRIDVDNPSGGLNYGIPSDNPFVGNTEGWREEIWAWGFRNTWRASFDPVTGWLWGGENGEDRWEELNVIEAGKNYGWKIMEGESCFEPATGCDMQGLELPVWTYGGTSERRSVIGGYVYRGSALPTLQGFYIYGDFLLGTIWVHNYEGMPASAVLATGQAGLTSFGLDEAGELYFLRTTGSIYRFTTTTSGSEPLGESSGFRLFSVYPNPATASSMITYHLPTAAGVEVTILDALGRVVARPVRAQQSAGLHRVEWAAETHAGGVYLVLVRVGDEVQTRRFVQLH